MVIWVTGLAGAGKTTFARKLTKILRETLQGVFHLDGDHLRQILDDDKLDSYLKKNRLLLARKYGKLAKALSDQNAIVVVSTISLFNEVHLWNRANIKSYFDILLSPSFEVLQKRDQKQLYSDYTGGLVTNVSGLDQGVEFPSNPDFEFDHFGPKEVRNVAQLIIKSYYGGTNENCMGLY